jgi:mutator protein MutT
MNKKINAYTYQETIRYCPRCGKDNFKAASDKNFQCSACQFVLYFNPSATVVAVIKNDEQEILFTERAKDPAKGKLDLPGGFVDFYEKLEQALIREIKEELNVEIGNYTYLFSMTNLYPYKDFIYHSVDSYFQCEVTDTSKISACDEVDHIHWLSLHNVNLDDIGFQSVKDAITRLRQMQ